MRFYLIWRIGKNNGFMKAEALHHAEQPFQKRNAEEDAERMRSIGEDD